MELQTRLLEALNACLHGQTVGWKDEISQPEWESLLRLAEVHRVLPLIYEAVYDCPAFRSAPQSIRAWARQRTVHEVMGQTANTAAFLQCWQWLQQAGITPIVVKGIVCRAMYPKPDHRISSDEDLVIPAAQAEACRGLLLQHGMQEFDVCSEGGTFASASYLDPRTGLHLEIQTELFFETDALSGITALFDGYAQRLTGQEIQAVSICTLGAADHLLYLILHAFKHFIHSGVGIRQICDIVMWGERYGDQINWEKLLQQCRAVHADCFAAAVFQIGRKLGVVLPLSDDWRSAETDCAPMLEDMMEGGIYGAANRSRLHSSTITLHAVQAQRQGKKAAASVRKTLFPSAHALEKRYPYLQDKPYLLPAAWCSRILTYRRESKSCGKENNAAESIKIGARRVELLRMYHIIE